MSDIYDTMFEGNADTGAVFQTPNPLTPAPRSKRKSPFSDAMDVVSGTAWTALDAGTAGTSRLAAGLFGGATSLGSGKGFFEGAKRSYEEADDFLREQREGLPGGLGLAAEVAGAFGGAPRLMDNAVDHAARPFAPAVADKMKNYALGVVMDVPAASVENYLRGDMGFDDAMQSGVLDAVVGRTAQLGIGDLAVPFIQKAWRKVRGLGPEGYAVSSVAEGALAEVNDGLTLSRMYEMSKQLPDVNTTLLDQPGVGSAATMRFHNTLSDMAFANPDARKLNTRAHADAVQAYRNMVDEAEALTAKANTDALSRVDDVIGMNTVVAPNMRTAEQARAAKTFDDVGRVYYPEDHPKAGTVPLGATTIEAIPFRDEARKSYEDAFGRNLTQMSPEQRRVWNEFKHILRATEVEELGGAAKVKPVTGSVDSRNPDSEENYFKEVTVAQLYSGRKDLADLLKPMANLDGKPLNGQQRKAITTMLGVLDQKIDDVVGPEIGLARGVWASEMKAKEAARLGADFYSKRMPSVADKEFEKNRGQSITEFMATLKPNELKQFKAGYVGAMADATRMGTVHAELRNLFGELDTGNDLKISQGALADVEAVLGKDAVKQLRTIYTDDSAMIDVRNDLVDFLRERGGTPEQIQKAVGPRGNLPRAMLTDADDGAILKALNVLKRVVQPKDKDRVEAMFNLVTAKGSDLQKLLKTGVEQAAPGGGVQIGSRATSLAVAPEGEEEEYTEEEFEGLYEFLNSPSTP